MVQLILKLFNYALRNNVVGFRDEVRVSSLPALRLQFLYLLFIDLLLLSSSRSIVSQHVEHAQVVRRSLQTSHHFLSGGLFLSLLRKATLLAINRRSNVELAETHRPLPSSNPLLIVVSRMVNGWREVPSKLILSHFLEQLFFLLVLFDSFGEQTVEYFVVP